ncbi:uncharacterized protein LOC6645491 [Drosophila willistoni]|uniref:uncharacterized protein LOC6645491 n=1 Tax=Drosophila willistoni TaxID=7260 RepID=UPI000C26C968|nr:uncharacterized protein LOC6645491 [Drosophila willistoni]
MDMDTNSDACSMSSLESESDLSLAFEQDQDNQQDGGGCDELPAFDTRALSPHGRTPSPINDLNLSDIETPKQQPQHQLEQTKDDQVNLQSHPDFVALHEINAQISPPSDANDSKNNLETIFEGVFLQTPPREKTPKSSPSSSSSSSRFTPKRSRANLMELVAMNRIQNGKENQSPSTKWQCQ